MAEGPGGALPVASERPDPIALRHPIRSRKAQVIDVVRGILLGRRVVPNDVEANVVVVAKAVIPMAKEEEASGKPGVALLARGRRVRNVRRCTHLVADDFPRT